MKSSTYMGGIEMTEKTSIKFIFNSKDDAVRAYETLAELGYKPELDDESRKPCIYIQPFKQDLSSALEITQIFGGVLAVD